MRALRVFLTSLCLTVSAATPLVSTPASVERWGVFELSMTGPVAAQPYLDIQWSATFTQGERRITVPGFWDGGDAYKVRFSPPTAGAWRCETRGSAAGLNGRTGAFTVAAATGNNHGPVEVVDTFYLRYADGTPHHSFGTTCSQLFAAGSFLLASGKPATNIASWHFRRTLKGTHTGSQLALSWPGPETNAVLDVAADLAAPNWEPVGMAPVLLEGRLTVTNAIEGRHRFYRLRSP